MAKTKTEAKLKEAAETAKAEVEEVVEAVEAKVEAEVDKAEVVVKSNRILFALTALVGFIAGVLVGALIF